MNNWGRLAVFDLETTGVDTDTSRVVSACIALLGDNGTVIARWDWLANPGIEIPDGAAAVHGITTERARALGRPALQVIAEVAQSLRMIFGMGIPLAIYNAPYDLTLLDRELRRHGLETIDNPGPIIDPLVIDKALDRYRKGKRTLEATSALYGVPLLDAHDAGSDAIAAGLVAQALAAAYPAELDVSLPELHTLQVGWYAAQSASFADYIRRVRPEVHITPSPVWPLHPTEFPSTIVDTLPLPPLPPRPSHTVPHLDFTTGMLELDGRPLVLEAPKARLSLPPVRSVARPSAYASAPAPHRAPSPEAPPHPAPSQSQSLELTARPVKALTILRMAAGIITDPDGRALVLRLAGATSFSQASGLMEKGESAYAALDRALGAHFGFTMDPDATEYLGSFRSVDAAHPGTVTRVEIFAMCTGHEFTHGNGVDEVLWIETEDPDGVDLDLLARGTVLPLWTSRRAALF